MNRWLVVVALTACSPATWRPPSNAETVRIVDDLIVRSESDGTTSVTARVTLDDASATGFVRLHDADLSTAATSKHVRLARARAWYALVEILVAEPERAYQAARQGSAVIGNPGRVDSRASSVANLAVLNNDYPAAARTLTEFLVFSLRAYTQRFHDEVW